MGFVESLFNFGVMETRAGSLGSVRESNGEDAGFYHMLPQFRQVDFVESVRHGVIVQQIVRLFLIRNECWNAFQKEVEVIRTPIGVGGESRGIERFQRGN